MEAVSKMEQLKEAENQVEPLKLAYRAKLIEQLHENKNSTESGEVTLELEELS